MSQFDEDWDRFYDYPDENMPERVLKFNRIVRQTLLAWLIEFEVTKNLDAIEAWLPKSQCHITGRENTIEVPEWLVEEKELWDYEIV